MEKQLKALKVIRDCTNIANFLRREDPMALKQVNQAIKDAEGKIFIEYVPEQQRMEDILCNATECGYCSFRIVKYIFPEGQTKESLGIEYKHIELPYKGGTIVFDVPEDDDGKTYNLDKEAMFRGVKVMAEKYPKHFADFREENDDAVTADVWLQCALLGELVYG